MVAALLETYEDAGVGQAAGGAAGQDERLLGKSGAGNREEREEREREEGGTPRVHVPSMDFVPFSINGERALCRFVHALASERRTRPPQTSSLQSPLPWPRLCHISEATTVI
jgi:hypothetical protein